MHSIRIAGIAALMAVMGMVAATPAASEGARIVGSSTVSPFADRVAAEVAAEGIRIDVESTGTGGGFRLFCAGSSSDLPMITNASRPITDKEREACRGAGILDIIEVEIGYDGIVVAQATQSLDFDLALVDLFRAFAKSVPEGAGTDAFGTGNCQMVPNPNRRWRDVRADLPRNTIEAYGPPPTSGTRDAFLELAMEGGAKAIPCLKDLRARDKAAFTEIAHSIRNDKAWIDSGENDDSIVEVLLRRRNAVGIFGYSFLERNTESIKAVAIGGQSPSVESIASRDYPLARPLFFYVKAGGVAQVPALQSYVQEFLSREALGAEGYLADTGLIALDADAENSCAVLKATCTSCQCTQLE